MIAKTHSLSYCKTGYFKYRMLLTSNLVNRNTSSFCWVATVSEISITCLHPVKNKFLLVDLSEDTS